MSNTYESFEPGMRVKWWHSNRNGTTHYSGEITGQASSGKPYMKVRRDDTKKIVLVRTTALRTE